MSSHVPFSLRNMLLLVAVLGAALVGIFVASQSTTEGENSLKLRYFRPWKLLRTNPNYAKRLETSAPMASMRPWRMASGLPFAMEIRMTIRVGHPLWPLIVAEDGGLAISTFAEPSRFGPPI
jgi:hypothetical protein